MSNFVGLNRRIRVVAFGAALTVGGVGSALAQAPTAAAVTFTKDIAPILQRSCQNCHRADGGAPMSLTTYEEVRPWARSIKNRTGIGPRAGVMPPWYMEKNIGIQKFHDDPSLSAKEIAMIAQWADSGAPMGNPADLPPAKTWDDAAKWAIGEPDLIIKTTEITVKANSPDWWGEIPRVLIPLKEDRYVTAIQVREVNDVDVKGSGRQTVGGKYVFHHMIWGTRVLKAEDGAEDDLLLAALDPGTTAWPVHEVGRNADFFGLDSARLLKAGSSLVSDSIHLHSNGRDTKAYLEIGFKFAPVGFKPKFRRASVGLGNGVDIDIDPNDANQQLHAYAVLNENVKILSFEPHLHAPGKRMCLEAIWGYNIQTLNCVGYDHNWVRGYNYTDESAPLLPRGTILHIIGYMDNSPSNKNVPDPRNWQGSGNRSVANMFIDLGARVALSDDQFKEEMAKRRALNPGKDVIPGCPLCTLSADPPKPTNSAPRQQQ